MRKIIITTLQCLLLFFLSPCAGATSISIGEFLATALHDPTLSAQIERIDFLQQTPEGISFIEDPELRITVEQFEKDRQKYAFRFTPRGLGELRREKEMQIAMVESNRAELKRLFNTALKIRYMAVINFFYFSKMETLHQNLNALLGDREMALKRYVETSDFDAEKVADAESERIQVELDLIELTNQKDAVADNIREAIGSGEPLSLNSTPVVLDESQIIGVEQIPDKIGAIDFSGGAENISLWTLKADAQIAEAQYRLKSAEKKRLIGFIETAYSAEDRDDFDKAFSIELAIAIPVNSGNQVDMNEKRLESMRSRDKLNTLERELNKTIPAIHRELNNLIQKYKKVKRGKDDGFTSSAFNRLVQVEGTDPLTLLELKERVLKSDILLTKLSWMVLTEYINLLDLTGKLSQKPLINYLAYNLQEIGK